MRRSTAGLPGLPLMRRRRQPPGRLGSCAGVRARVARPRRSRRCFSISASSTTSASAVGLQALELLAGLHRCFLLAFEFGALFVDLLHRDVEVVEFDGGCAACDGCLSFGGDAGVGLVEVDQERDRSCPSWRSCAGRRPADSIASMRPVLRRRRAASPPRPSRHRACRASIRRRTWPERPHWRDRGRPGSPWLLSRPQGPVRRPRRRRRWGRSATAARWRRARRVHERSIGDRATSWTWGQMVAEYDGCMTVG